LNMIDYHINIVKNHLVARYWSLAMQPFCLTFRSEIESLSIFMKNVLSLFSVITLARRSSYFFIERSSVLFFGASKW